MTQKFKDYLTVDYAPGMPDLIKKKAKKRKGADDTSGVVEATVNVKKVEVRDVYDGKDFGVVVHGHDGKKYQMTKLPSGKAMNKAAAQKAAEYVKNKKTFDTRHASSIVEAAPEGHKPFDAVGYMSQGMKWDPKLKKMVPATKKESVEIDEQKIDPTKDHYIRNKDGQYAVASGWAEKSKIYMWHKDHTQATRFHGRIVKKVIDNHGGKHQAVLPSSIKEDLDEALTHTQRLAKKRQMKRYKSKIKLGRERASRKMADPDRLATRSRRAARKLIFGRLAKDVDKSDMSYQRRAEIEKRLDKMGPRIDRLAKRLLPKVRKKEMERRRGAATKESDK